MENDKKGGGTNALVPSGWDLTPKNLEEAMEMAKLIANSDLAPKDYKGKPGNVLIAVSMGKEVGLKTMQAIQGIAVINGRPCLWGDALLAVVQASPKFVKIEESFDDKTMTATCKVWRKGNPNPHVGTFSKADAEKAGLWGQNVHKKYPKRMLQMRARGFGCRDGFADALKGMQSAEEQRDVIQTTAEVIPEVEPKSAAGKTEAAKPAADATSEASDGPNGLKQARFKVKKVTRTTLEIDGKDTPCALIYPDAEGAPRYYAVELTIGELAKKAKKEDHEFSVYFDETDVGLRIVEAQIPETANA